MKPNAPNACSQARNDSPPGSPTLRVHPVAVTAYLFCACLVYLAAAYLGGTYTYIVAVIAALPLTSLAHALLCFRGVWVEADVSSLPRVRGDRFSVAVRVGSTRRSPTALWRLPVHFVGPDSGGRDRAVTESLAAPAGRGRRTDITRSFVCRHRGDYEIVFGPLTTVDMLGWLSLSKPEIRHRVHVYPRALKVNPATGAAGQTNAGRSHSRHPDFTLLHGLIRYREGLPVRHIAWKKFAAHGIPYLKEYEQGESETVRVYFDSRRPVGPSRTHADVIDHSLETAVATLRAFLAAGTSIEFISPPLRYRGSGLRDFDSIYRATRLLRFASPPADASFVSGIEALLRTQQSDTFDHGAIVVISHLPDEQLLLLPERAAAAGHRCRLILCSYNWSLDQVWKARAATNIRDAVRIVKTSDELIVQSTEGGPPV